ncbi:MAG: radical SAM protein [Clostridia bacterium]|nr:radical SAM protein [Clostridia bacterium]
MRDTCIFYKDEAGLAPLLRLYPDCEKQKLRAHPDRSVFLHRERQKIVYAVANDDLQRLTALCRGLTFAGVFVYPTDSGSLPERPLPIDISKPRLDYLEAEICHVCNLNCRACTNYSNLRQKTGFYELAQFEKDLRRLKELFWGITKIRLMGGEPLINPETADYAALCREIFPDCDLRIASNGLLLPTVKPETLGRLRDCGASFDISEYPPTRAKKEEIKKTVSAAGLRVSFGVPIRVFFKLLREKPNADPREAFRNCIFSNCHIIEDGWLAPCTSAMCIDRFNAFYGEHYPQTDRFALTDPSLDGWQIIEAFSHPHEFCRYCGTGLIPVKWEGHVGPERAKKEDWLIRDSFLSDKIAPLIQKTLKPAALRLRETLQKKQ